MFFFLFFFLFSYFFIIFYLVFSSFFFFFFFFLFFNDRVGNLLTFPGEFWIVLIPRRFLPSRHPRSGARSPLRTSEERGLGQSPRLSLLPGEGEGILAKEVFLRGKRWILGCRGGTFVPPGG